MYSRDYRDIVGGSLLAALGLFVALYATHHYELGTLTRMGSGMFPVALGYLLAALGFIIVLPAFFREGTRMSIRWRPFVTCLAAVLLFAVMVDRFGMVPAILALVLASALAAGKLQLAGALILAVALAAMGAIIFGYGLGMAAPLFAWRV